MVVLRLTSR